MSKVTITQAAKMANISRSTLYKKYITPGIISIILENNKKFIDVSELIRVFGNIQTKDTADVFDTQQKTPKNTQKTDDKDKLISLLESQLAEAKIRETWLKEQLEKTTLLLENKTTKKRKKFLGIF